MRLTARGTEDLAAPEATVWDCPAVVCMPTAMVWKTAIVTMIATTVAPNFWVSSRVIWHLQVGVESMPALSAAPGTLSLRRLSGALNLLKHRLGLGSTSGPRPKMSP